jgi:hypothetical protein
MTNTDHTDDGNGRVDRRKFVAGVSALGVAGVAGCLGDGGGDETDSPTDEPNPDSPAPPTESDTDTETDTRTPTETATPTPTGPEFEPIPTNLVYQFFEGSFDEMPNFDSLAPADSGEPDVITADPADGPGAFRYTGTLPIGGRLPQGTYTFHADQDLVSEGRLAMYLGSNQLNFSGGTTSLFLNSDGEITVEYLQNSGDGQISLGWEGTNGELLPRIADTDPLRQSRQAQGRYEVEVSQYPNSKRMQMPNSGSEESKRSLAVGLPSLRHFCFDANTAGVQYGWNGAFLDYGPLVSYGGGRGDDEGQPLGNTFDVGGMDYPLRIGNPDAEPEVEFHGYRETPHPPELHYSLDGMAVTQAVSGVTDGVGLEYTFQFEQTPSQAVYFHTAEDADVEREASMGSWSGGTLEITDQTTEFTVTITNTGGGQ